MYILLIRCINCPALPFSKHKNKNTNFFKYFLRSKSHDLSTLRYDTLLYVMLRYKVISANRSLHDIFLISNILFSINFIFVWFLIQLSLCVYLSFSFSSFSISSSSFVFFLCMCVGVVFFKTIIVLMLPHFTFYNSLYFFFVFVRFFPSLRLNTEMKESPICFIKKLFSIQNLSNCKFFHRFLFYSTTWHIASWLPSQN